MAKYLSINTKKYDEHTCMLGGVVHKVLKQNLRSM